MLSKKYKKILKWLLFIILFTILLFVIAVVCVYLYRKALEQSTVNLFTEDKNYKHQLVIPVEIADSTYYFLYDTGCTDSFIDSDLINRLNLDIQSDKIHKNFSGTHKEITDSFNVVNIRSKLGEMMHTNYFFYNEKNIFYVLDPDIDPRIKGIIGQNIISCFYWLFDFRKSKALISKKPIDLDYETEQDILSFQFEILPSSGIPVINLVINNQDTTEFYFDTGFRISAKLDELKFFPSWVMNNDEIIFSEQKKESMVNNICIKDGLRKITICDSIYVNKFQLYNMSFMNENLYKKSNYITTNLIFQFEKMYYNPKDREISLINYRNRINPIGEENKIRDYVESLGNK